MTLSDTFASCGWYANDISLFLHCKFYMDIDFCFILRTKSIAALPQSSVRSFVKIFRWIDGVRGRVIRGLIPGRERGLRLSQRNSRSRRSTHPSMPGIARRGFSTGASLKRNHRFSKSHRFSNSYVLSNSVRTRLC